MWGARLWPAVFIGSVLVWGVVRDGPAITVLVDAVGETFAIVAVIRLLRLWGFDPGLSRFRDPFLLVVSAVVARFLAAAIDLVGLGLGAWLTPGAMPASYGNLITDATGAYPVVTHALVTTTLNWILNGVAGIVLVVPAVTASPRPLTDAFRRRSPTLFILAGLLLAWCIVLFVAPPGLIRLPLFFLALALTAAAATNLGVMATAIATLVTSLTFIIASGLVLGAGVTGALPNGREIVWSAVGFFALMGLALGPLLEERRRSLRELESLADRYRRLFDGNPVALFVTEVATGRILMSNEAAARSFGYDHAALHTMSMDDLILSGSAVTHSTHGDAVGSPVLSFRTRSGACREIACVKQHLTLDGAASAIWYAIDVTERNELRRQLLAAADLERARLAQELHDGLGQVLTALGLGAHGVVRKAESGKSLGADDLAFVESTVQAATVQLAQLTEGVSPLAASDGDLIAALKRLGDSLPPDARARTSVIVEGSADITLPLEGREHLYRVVQEALNNALKHADATSLQIRVRADREKVAVTVADDGAGMKQSPGAASGMGLRSMALRARAAGGELTVSTPSSGGTVLTVECPQTQAEAPANDAPTPDVGHGVDPERAPEGTGGKVWGIAIESLALALACVGGALVTQALLSGSGSRLGMATPQLAVPSLLAGLCSAALLVRGRQLWPGIFIGVTVVDVALWQLSWAYSLINAAASALTAIAIVALLRKWRFDRRFDHWRAPLVLFAAAALCWLVNDVATGLILVALARLDPDALGPAYVALMIGPGSTTPAFTPAFQAAVARWWFDATAGVALVVPAVAAIPPVWTLPRGRHFEVGAWCLCVALWCVALYTGGGPHVMLGYLTSATVLEIWAAVQFGVALAAFGTFVFAMVAAACFALGRGIAAMTGALPPIVNLWAFVTVLTCLSLFLTALLAERYRRLREAEALGERYRRLFALDPHPIYACLRETGRILIANAAAVRAFGYPERELLGRTCYDLEPGATRKGPLPAREERRETRQVTKQGRVFETEIRSAPIDLDGDPATLCFASDLTERNELRRGHFEATDLERRRLAFELRSGLGKLLASIGESLRQLRRAIESGTPPQEHAIAIAGATRDATALCRRLAHRASPLRAHDGDLVAAVQDLASQLPVDATATFSVRLKKSAEIALSPTDREHLYELVREAAIDAAANAGSSSIVVSLDIEPSLLRVEISTSSGARGAPRLTVRPGMRLRAVAMGAQLWEASFPDGRTSFVCECPQGR